MKNKIKHSAGDVSSEGILSSISNVSKVTKEKRFAWIERKFVFLIIGIILIIIFTMILSDSGKKNKTQNVQQTQMTLSGSDESELENNLAQLSRMHQQVQSVQFSVLDDSAINSKEYLARQNAPTTMYSATIVNHPKNNSRSKNANIFVGKNSYSAFGNQATVSTSVNAQRIANPRFTVASGEFIHAILETAIDSDLPGQLRAVISEPVYAYVGEKPLIPAGSRLIGQYSSAVTQGQNRIFVIWNRVILPNGITIQLNSPGVDAIGQAGVSANSINTHFFARFSEAVLLSVIGAGVANLGVSTNDQYNSASAYRTAIAHSLQQSANQSLKNTVSTQPTLRVFQGATINVFVAHDLDFYRADHG